MEDHKLTRKEKIEISFLILIGVFILLLVVAIFTLKDNIELLKQEPVEYAIENTALEGCSCWSKDSALPIIYPRSEGKDVIENWTTRNT